MKSAKINIIEAMASAANENNGVMYENNNENISDNESENGVA
jgi:hypothetical protein